MQIAQNLISSNVSKIHFFLEIITYDKTEKGVKILTKDWSNYNVKEKGSFIRIGRMGLNMIQPMTR